MNTIFDAFFLELQPWFVCYIDYTMALHSKLSGAKDALDLKTSILDNKTSP